ncbi:uncharacterized protein [Temnothorax nylanderi]|uniref:uncharacterized protein n=2 Tax=Temnothorax TaxID=300110 RepID=UPI003A8C2B0F
MYTVFTPGGKDALAIERESQILAIFDTMGHGVVFDVDGAARLSYNQIGGIFTDNPAGLPLVWAWNANPRESILETVYTVCVCARERCLSEFFPLPSSIDFRSIMNKRTELKPFTYFTSPSNHELKICKGNFYAIPTAYIYHIKVICMKLNEFLGLRIIDRRNISLRFSARNKSIRIELGTILNFNKEVASHMVEASDWKSDMLRCRFQEKLSKKLESEDSLYDLAKEYRKVKRFAKERKAMLAKYKPFSGLSRAFS